jgi:hypothetical protein
MAETPWSPFTTYFLKGDGSIVIDQNPKTLIPDNQGSSYDLLTEPLEKIQEYIRKKIEGLNNKIASADEKKKETLEGQLRKYEELLRYSSLSEIPPSLLTSEEISDFLQNYLNSPAKIIGKLAELQARGLAQNLTLQENNQITIETTNQGRLTFLTVSASVFPNYSAEGYNRMEDPRKVITPVPLVFTLKNWPEGKKSKIVEDWTNNPVICTGTCMFDKYAIQIIQENGEIKYMTSPRANDQVNGKVHKIEIDESPTAYETNSLQTLFNAIKAITHQNNCIEKVTYDIPSLPYYLYAMDMLEQGHVQPEQLKPYFAAVYKKASRLKNLVTKLMEGYNAVRQKTGYNPIDIEFSTIGGDLEAEYRFILSMLDIKDNHDRFHAIMEYITNHDPRYTTNLLGETVSFGSWYELGARSYARQYEEEKPGIVVENYVETGIAAHVKGAKFIGFYIHPMTVNQSTKQGPDDSQGLYFALGGLKFAQELQKVQRKKGMYPSPVANTIQ